MAYDDEDGVDEDDDEDDDDNQDDEDDDESSLLISRVFQLDFMVLFLVSFLAFECLALFINIKFAL